MLTVQTLADALLRT